MDCEIRRAWLGFVVVAFLIALPIGVASAETYRWVDEQGNVHFTFNLDGVPERFRKDLKPYVPPEAVAAPGPRNREQIHPLCGKSTAIETPVDADVRRVYQKIFTEDVRKDIRPYQIDVFTVLDDQQYPAGFICFGNPELRVHTIIVPVNTLVMGLEHGELDRAIAQILSHELAHAARHGKPEGRTGAIEREADELGIYYYERAGYDCRTWRPVNPPHGEYADRSMVQMACLLAKKNLRPPRRPLSRP